MKYLLYDVTKISGYFRLPLEELTELKNMGRASISYLFNDDVFIIICDKNGGYPKSIKLLSDGTVSEEKENVIKLRLENTTTITAPYNVPLVEPKEKISIYQACNDDFRKWFKTMKGWRVNCKNKNSSTPD